MEKKKVLALMGCLNRSAEAVEYELFHTGGKFFDPGDKIQVKYEMLRAVQVEGIRISEVPRLFGYSRETYYTAARRFASEGCAGLLDEVQGRRQPEKLQRHIVDFILKERISDPSHNSGKRLQEKVLERFHVKVHRCTIYKVLKKGAWRIAAGTRNHRRRF